MRNRLDRLLSTVFALVVIACVACRPSLAQEVRAAVVPDADRAVPFILDLHPGEFRNLPPEQKQDESTYREAFYQAGDLAYDNTEGGVVVAASG